MKKAVYILVVLALFAGCGKAELQKAPVTKPQAPVETKEPKTEPGQVLKKLEKKLLEVFADAGLKVQTSSARDSLDVQYKTRKRKVWMKGPHYPPPRGQTYYQNEMLGPEDDGLQLCLNTSDMEFNIKEIISREIEGIPWKVYHTSYQFKQKDKVLYIHVSLWYGEKSDAELIEKLKRTIASCSSPKHGALTGKELKEKEQEK